MQDIKAKESEDSFALFKAIIDSTLEGIIVYDKNKKCIEVNRVITKLLAYTEEEMLTKDALDFIAPESKALVQRFIKNHIQEPYEAVMQRKDGSKFPAILRGKDIEVLGKEVRVSAVLDISYIKEREKEILNLTRYDYLTKVPNSLMLKEEFPKINKSILNNSHYGALLFIDLDNFKIINDIKGHSLGDMILIETAVRLKNILDNSSLLVRQGGDEFFIIVNTKTNKENEAISFINNVSNKILTEINKSYLVMEYELRLTASIGISVFNERANLEELMKYADTAMYNSKEKGKNTYSYFDPKLQRLIEKKAYIIQKLSKAIEKNELILYYQKQISTKSNKSTIVGAEALIRWNSQKGLVPPNEFIGHLEDSGLIISVGKWILEESIKQIKIWQNDHIKKDWIISVNISPKQFDMFDFTKTVISLIKKYNIDPSKLRLELTENILIKNVEQTLEKINHLSSFGVRLSIDDFGTGYSSLMYLKKLPIHELKIDQAFIRDILIDKNDYSIVETILTIGGKFNLDVIAEGVETKEQHEMLVKMGCEFFQGYLFAKPVSPEFL